MINRTLFAICAAAACASTVADIPPTTSLMRPGQYEMTSHIEMPMQSFRMPPRKDSACVTAEDLKDWSRNLVKAPEGVTCKLTEYKQSGNQLNYLRECTNKTGGHTTFKGTVTFTPPDTYQAVVNMNGANAGANALTRGTTITINAHRTGDCSK
jgi:hypothetical protein